MRVLLDVDGVLADFHGHAINTIPEVAAYGYTSENFPTWNVRGVLTPEEGDRAAEVFASKGWCEGIPAYPGAREGLDKLRKVAEVYFVTAPYPSEPWMWERAQWLQDHMGATERDWVMTHAKHLCVGDVFVDDKYENALNWHRFHPDKLAVLWNSRPGCHPAKVEKEILVTRDWDVVLAEMARRQR